jgi:hypothetical protein
MAETLGTSLGGPLRFLADQVSEGRDVVFEHRSPNEQPERFVSLVREPVRAGGRRGD